MSSKNPTTPTTKPPSSSKDPPDPLLFPHWSTAFQTYPLPQIRNFETTLRKALDSNNTKLRSLVGSSYRELLDTAERIIDMDERMGEVEEKMEGIGRGCNVGVIERKRGSVRRMKMVVGGLKGGDIPQRRAVVGRVKLLEGVIDVVGRRIKRGREMETIVAGKLVVLGRLLLKSVVDIAEEGGVLGDMVDELRKRLVGLRRRLLGFIERVLGKPDVERSVSIDTLCAYALVTSSNPTDVLKYFLRVRLEQMQAVVDSDSTVQESDVLQLLTLYQQTVVDTRALFPKQMAEAMAKLQKVPLLQDPQITTLGELNLDIYGRWIDENIRAFTPWVRHDQLVGSDVEKGISSWLVQAQQSLLTALRQCLAVVNTTQTFVEIRGRVLQKFLPMLEADSHARHGSHVETFHDLRTAFLTRLDDLASELIGSILLELDTQDTDSTTTTSLWNMASSPISIKSGASDFRSTILQKRHGRDPLVSRNFSRLNTWLTNLDTLWETSTQIRTSKWDTDEIDLDLSPTTDNPTPLSQTLTKGDASHLQTTLTNLTTTHLQNLYTSIAEKAASSAENPAQLLRLLRDLDSLHSTSLTPASRISTSTNFLPADVIPSLHEKISSQVFTAVETRLSKGNKPLLDFKTTRALWDAGTPPVPLQPSVQTFRMLADVQKGMEMVGADLWSAGAVGVLRGVWVERMLEWMDGNEGEKEIGEKEQSGEKKGGNEEEEKRESDERTEGGNDKKNDEGKGDDKREEKMKQQLFDLLLLSLVLAPGDGSAVKQLEAAVGELKAELRIEQASFERLKKNAAEYWKRTYLLFGLLANSSQR